MDNPDYCLIDLDPHDIPFSKVIEAALEIHQLLEEIEVKHYCKTSGKKGLHIIIPLQAKYNFEQSRQFAELISHYVHQKLPKTTSLLRKTRTGNKEALSGLFTKPIWPNVCGTLFYSSYS